MSDWLLNLPLLWMGALILGAIYVCTAGLYLLITALAVGERARAFKGVSPGMLPPLSLIFGLLVGFLAAQVWNDADRANTAVNGEASALRATVLARGKATLALAPARLAEALRLALTLTPRSEGQIAAQREMVASLQRAFESRRQRIILSRSSINWVKWTVLFVQAGLTLLAIAMVHSDNRATNRIILAIFATGVGTAVVLIAAHSRPFTGEISVHPTVLLQVMPEAGPAAASP